MGLFSTLFGSKPEIPEVALSLDVDLGSFKSGQTALGERPKPSDPYTEYIDASGLGSFEKSGIEISVENGVLDCVFITLVNFSGRFLRNGSEILISTRTTTEEIISQFGEPYWRDTDEDETILFYEYQNGHVELQFEFSDKRHLSAITLSRDGVLSKADQRKAYRVTKNWPPR
jgi:hypothetical protein